MCRKFQTVLAQKQYMQSENILQKKFNLKSDLLKHSCTAECTE